MGIPIEQAPPLGPSQHRPMAAPPPVAIGLPAQAAQQGGTCGPHAGLRAAAQSGQYGTLGKDLAGTAEQMAAAASVATTGAAVAKELGITPTQALKFGLAATKFLNAANAPASARR